MRTIEPMREATFKRKLKEHRWKKAYEIVCAAYQKLHPTFSIAQDNYGDYRLLDTGKDTVRTPAVFRRNPMGLFREVPEGVATKLSIMSSERTGKQLLLLWPMGFVNSDCSANCEYDFSSE